MTLQARVRPERHLQRRQIDLAGETRIEGFHDAFRTVGVALIAHLRSSALPTSSTTSDASRNRRRVIDSSNSATLEHPAAVEASREAQFASRPRGGMGVVSRECVTSVAAWIMSKADANAAAAHASAEPKWRIGCLMLGRGREMRVARCLLIALCVAGVRVCESQARGWSARRHDAGTTARRCRGVDPPRLLSLPRTRTGRGARRATIRGGRAPDVAREGTGTGRTRPIESQAGKRPHRRIRSLRRILQIIDAIPVDALTGERYLGRCDRGVGDEDRSTERLERQPVCRRLVNAAPPGGMRCRRAPAPSCSVVSRAGDRPAVCAPAADRDAGS